MRRKQLLFMAFLLVFIPLLIACGKKDMKMEKSADMSYGGYTKNDTGSVAPAENSVVEESKAKATTDDRLTSTTSIQANQTQNHSQDKIIRYVDLEVETQDFDGLISSIDTHINQLGGYVESSNISGRGYYSYNTRYGSIVARIPKDRLQDFLTRVEDISNVINRRETTENVTLEYVDAESHKKALEIEQERLLALLEKVETLEDIIALEGRLSSVRYELESYEARLRVYDNLVEYSTVTMNIHEVERMTPVAEVKLTTWDKIKTGFRETILNIGEGFENFFIWFIVNLPYLIIWAIIIGIVVIIGRRYVRKNKNKNNSKKKEENEKRD